ncbi:MAG: hypothetical protein U1A24_08380 [Cypionkella sp.]|uniref:hypothetical protein n=1 Tax=Cypionkella sp. TaxID=2811411 RepID=UPI002AB93E07|nr:hypothetical protein [Cypionkella sp.]MDZ4310560.1 hypothetical protein [Cypionkella sp.]
MFDDAETGVKSLYQAKCRDEGLVDVKFLHKNLDEGSREQVLQDLLNIQNAISQGQTQPLDFGDFSLKKAI